ncbi:MAG: HAMP domain-containing histidine kinase [Elusimicrobia bacterium]|nr:HAMP domain-containing histidine kinase [Elusimicrobiota bacterium]
MWKSATREGETGASQKYEAIFCIFLVVIAFLFRDDANFVYPQILYLFSILFLLNLGAGFSLRLWPEESWLAALITLANAAIITVILSYSGGENSNLWVLYLLPIYTSSLLLGTRETVWITLGVIGFNAVYYYLWGREPLEETLFMLGLKSGIFAFAAATTSRVAHRQRRAKQELAQQRQQMELLIDSMQSQGLNSMTTGKLADVELLTAGVAHDLNNALLVIIGTSELMFQEGPSSPNFKPDLQQIRQSSLFCKNIIADLLGSVKEKEPKFVPCDIHDVLDSALSLYGGVLAKSRVKINKQFNENLPKASGSFPHLQRLLLNLISNARDSMKDGGVLTLRTESAPARSSQSSEWIQVAVEDTGPGISKEALGSLFKPFYTTKAPDKGMGIGLFLCREIAKKHGGKLSADNLPEGGARFVLQLPAH